MPEPQSSSDGVSEPSLPAPDVPAPPKTTANYGDSPPPPRILTIPEASHGRYTGNAFSLDAEGNLCCPAGKVLHPQRQQVLPNGAEQTRFAARTADCQACEQRASCVSPGSGSPRTVMGIFQVGSSPPVAPPARSWRTPDVWWCDSGGRAVRRKFVMEAVAAHRAGRPAPKLVPTP
jgi:hypothetical protein